MTAGPGGRAAGAGRLWRWGIVVLILLTPILSCNVLIRCLLGARPSQFVANYPNDLPEYWHAAETFMAVGFNGGYYVYDEAPPKAAFNHFGTWGPFYAVLTGTLARITGWAHESPVYFNVAYLTLGLAVFLLLGRKAQAPLAATLAFLATFWPIHLAIPTAFPECFQVASAMVLAAALFWRRQHAGDAAQRAGLLIVAFVAWLSLGRVSWALLLPAVIFEEARLRGVRLWPVPTCAAMVLVGLVVWSAGLVTGPGNSSVFDSITLLMHQPLEGSHYLLSRAHANADGLFRVGPLEMMLNLQVLAMVAGLPAAWLLSRVFAPLRRHLRGLGFHFYNCASILVASIVMYLWWGFFRVFAAPLALSCFLLILERRTLLVGVVVLGNVLVAPWLPRTYEQYRPNFTVSDEHRRELAQTLRAYLAYLPPPHSSWCNTILTSTATFDYRVSQAPAGFGLSSFRPRLPPTHPIRSHYLLLTDGEAQRIGNLAELRLLTPLESEDIKLYANLRSSCDLDGLSDDELMQAGQRDLDRPARARAATAEFLHVLERHPGDYGATYQLARALDAGGRPADARPRWEDVLAMADQRGDKATADTARARLQRRP